MSIQDFIDLIEGEGWYLDEYGCLCSEENNDCPLWFAYRYLDPDADGDAKDYMEAGRRIGLREKSAAAIAAAADNRGEPKLRKRLLKAAGIVDA